MIENVLPALLLGAVFCLAYAALLHLLIGRNLRDFLLSLLMATMGFGFGQVIGVLTAIPFLQIGQLHFAEASVGAWLLMAIARAVAP